VAQKTSITADASSPQTYHSDFPLDSVSLEEDFERDALATQKNTLSPIERNDSCSTPEESDTPTHALQFQLHSKDITKPDTVLLNVVRRIMQETNKLQKEIAAELNVRYCVSCARVIFLCVASGTLIHLVLLKCKHNFKMA
jgi:hypothetical protein